MGELFAAQTRIFDQQAQLTIVDAGVQLGHSSEEYLRAFPNCRVFGFEPEDANFAAALAHLAAYVDRVQLVKCALSDITGESRLHVNSHNGTHSLFAIGDQRYWEGYAATVAVRTVDTVALDSYCEAQGVAAIDILKMDIQGGELRALKGAKKLLERNAVSLIALEVLFHSLYQSQPMFWEIAEYLRSFGYGFHGLFECHYHSRNSNVLSWADAIFLAPRFLEVPEWGKSER